MALLSHHRHKVLNYSGLSMEQDHISRHCLINSLRWLAHQQSCTKSYRLTIWIEGYFGGYFALQILKFCRGPKLQQKLVSAPNILRTPRLFTRLLLIFSRLAHLLKRAIWSYIYAFTGDTTIMKNY